LPDGTIATVLPSEDLNGNYAVLAAKGIKLSASKNILPKGAKNVKYEWKNAAGDVVSTAKNFTVKADGDYTLNVTYTVKENGETKTYTDSEHVGVVKTFVPPVIDSKTGFKAIEWLRDDTATGGIVDGVSFAEGSTLQVVKGERLKLSVSIGAKNNALPTGPFKYTWYKNGKKIENSEYNIESTEKTTATLITDAFDTKADGYYVVVETVARAQKNGVDTDKPLASVKSKTLKPKIIIPPGEITVKTAAAKRVAKIGKSVTLAVKVTGTAKLAYIWTYPNGETVNDKNGNPVNKASITLKPENSGTTIPTGCYKVVVTNAAGEFYKQEQTVEVTADTAGSTTAGTANGEEHIH